MKPAPFDYYAPASVEEALEKLAELGYGGKVLAGGQSLIPAMNFRMAQPAALVDLNNIPALQYVNAAPEGFYIGTMTRDSVVENHPEIKAKMPVIAQAMHHVAHPQVRNRGTFGGLMAHADPAAQMPGVAVAVGFRMKIASKARGERWVDADDFFMGPFTTVIEPDEMLVEVFVPALKAREGVSYQQVERVKGAQSQAGVATFVALNAAGRIEKAKIVVICVGEVPVYTQKASQMLVGQLPSEAVFAEAAKVAATQEIEPGTDIHATAEYRTHIADVLIRRTLKEASDMAQRRGG